MGQLRIFFILLAIFSLSACKDLESVDQSQQSPTDEVGSGIELPEPDTDSEEPEVEEPVELEPWYKLSKPSDNDSAQKTVQLCSALGERSKKFSIDHFIIAFEGLASFNSSATNELYQKFENDPELLQVSVPKKSGSGGFMVNYLLWPVLKEAQGNADFVVFPQTAVGTGDVNSVPELCARAWLQAHPQGHLVITGHSYGGHATNQLAEILEDRNVPISTVITVDPRTKGYVGDLGRTSNTEDWINFYQKNTLFLNGYVVDGAENVNLSSTGISHGKIPSRPEVREALLEAVLKISFVKYR